MVSIVILDGWHVLNLFLHHSYGRQHVDEDRQCRTLFPLVGFSASNCCDQNISYTSHARTLSGNSVCLLHTSSGSSHSHLAEIWFCLFRGSLVGVWIVFSMCPLFWLPTNLVSMPSLVNHSGKRVPLLELLNTFGWIDWDGI